MQIFIPRPNLSSDGALLGISLKKKYISRIRRERILTKSAE
jgi:hypothetical protein